MRLRRLAHAWAIALDQLAYVTIAGGPYLISGGACPSPYETISSFVGRSANARCRWAVPTQILIDRLFVLLGSAPGHCQRSIIAEATIDASLP